MLPQHARQNNPNLRWEEAVDGKGRSYWKDRLHRKTQWNRPEHVNEPLAVNTDRHEQPQEEPHYSSPTQSSRSKSIPLTIQARPKPGLFMPKKISSQLRSTSGSKGAVRPVNGSATFIDLTDGEGLKSTFEAPLRIHVPAAPPLTKPQRPQSPSFLAPNSSPRRNNDTFLNQAKTTESLKSLLEDGLKKDNTARRSQGEKSVHGLNVSLLDHQVSGLEFLLGREAASGPCKGGLLADDMGLGKTIQSLALILKSTENASDESITASMDKLAVSGTRSSKLLSKGTLVVAPLALIRQWEAEITSKTRLRCLVHHGHTRASKASALVHYDVVITTYNLLVSEHQASTGVFGLSFQRIILDEAHSIKNKSSKSAIAACALEAKHRWCLSGTPLQNSVDELFSLFRFLRATPLDDFSEFQDKITRPISAGRGGLALERLQVVLSVIMLRRTKAVLQNIDVQLPERRVLKVEVDLSTREREFYAALEARTSNTLDKMMTAGVVGKNYTNVLVMLLRLRQACDHPHLVDTDYKDDMNSLGGSEDTDVLADLLGDMQVDSQARKCSICLTALSPDEKEPKHHCASCQSQLELSKSLTASTKITHILDILKSESRKTIIFSQFTSMLEQIAPFLKAENIPFEKYYGSMPNPKREASLHALRSDPSVMVLLCSLKCGALGLNLVAANRVILVDPWWNPQVSEQAIDRVHRIGQARDVDVYELTIKATVEERIMQLQEKKRQLAKAALEGSKVKVNKLNLQDMLYLFRRQAEE